MQIKREELDGLKEIKGEVRGVVFQTDAKYVLEKMGSGGLKKVKESAKKFGYEIPYETARAMKWYPIGLRVVSLLSIKDTFSWGDNEIRDMGYTAPKTSFLVKLLMKFFVSPEQFVEKVPVYWLQHWTVGKLEVITFDEENKEALGRLEEIEIHPILLTYFEGYFEKMLGFVKDGVAAKAKNLFLMENPAMSLSSSGNNGIKMKKNLDRMEEIQDTLAELEYYIRDFWEFLPIPTCYLNPLNIILDINKAGERLVGYKKIEIVGEKLEKLFGDIQISKQIEEEILEKEQIAERETKCFTKDREEMPVEVSAMQRKDENGNFIGYFLSIIGLTAFKKIQRQLELKIQDLEKFSRFATGRELKMIELKKEIKKLKKRLEQKG